MLDYRVIASGSSGNAVRIGSIMIDCGIPFRRMKDELYKCEALLITHKHTDHLNKKTLLSIMESFPRLQFYSCPTVAIKYPVINPITETPFQIRSGLWITPHLGTHDVEVVYFTFDIDGNHVIYATDTCQLQEHKDEKFDYLFLESNYDEAKLREIGKQYARKGYDPIEGSMRHLSTQKCKAFYYIHRQSPESQLIELHKSSRFY